MKLKKGDNIDLIAPSSFPVNKAWLEGVEILKDWGLNPCFPKDMIRQWLYHAHTNKKRSQFLQQAFKNKKSQFVWAIRGGYGLQKIMPDFIKNKYPKKTFIGFSDATALHLYLNTVCKIPSLHAPFVADLPHLSKKQLSFLKKVLFGQQEEIVFSNLKYFGKIPKAKKIKSPLIGGNLSLISTSLSSPWFPIRKEPYFLFLEDINEKSYSVDRFLHQLFFSGQMKSVKALFLGSFKPLKKEDLTYIFLKSFSEMSQIPIVMGFPVGHTSNNQPLPLGQMATLFVDKNKATVKIKT